MISENRTKDLKCKRRLWVAIAGIPFLILVGVVISPWASDFLTPWFSKLISPSEDDAAHSDAAVYASRTGSLSLLLIANTKAAEPRANVEVRTTHTGFEKTQNTNEVGRVYFEGVPSGRPRIRIKTKEGFVHSRSIRLDT